MIIRLPFPNMKLSPNQKNGKSYKTTLEAKQKQVADGYIITREAMHGYWNSDKFAKSTENIPLSLLYLTPDKRSRDLDNLLAASKALIDGMARAMGIDDSRFKPILIDCVLGEKPGALVAAVGVSIISSVGVVE